MLKEYTILSEGRTDTLKERVTQLLREGWQPIGGVAIAPNIGSAGSGCGFFILQAMVRDKADIDVEEATQ